jgi:hypothetical protein
MEAGLRLAPNLSIQMTPLSGRNQSPLPAGEGWREEGIVL